MYQFRPFRNSDPPALAEIWRQQPPHRGLLPAMTAGILEEFVFAKPYFDPAGLIVASRDDQLVGFAHASFGPNDERNALCTGTGTTQLVMTATAERDSQLPSELLGQAENYLRTKGAKVLYAGGIYPLNAFYLGLYGGSELPGVMDKDPLRTLLESSDYQRIDSVAILQCNLRSFRPVVSREVRQLRREFKFEEISDPPLENWWQACTIGDFTRLGYRLVSRGAAEPLASVWFWDVDPLSSAWGQRAAGLCDLYVDPEHRRRGLATALLGEALKQLRLRGVTLIEAQSMQQNEPALSLYGKLGFTVVDGGAVFRKQTSQS